MFGKKNEEQTFAEIVNQSSSPEEWTYGVDKDGLKTAVRYRHGRREIVRMYDRSVALEIEIEGLGKFTYAREELQYLNFPVEEIRLEEIELDSGVKIENFGYTNPSISVPNGNGYLVYDVRTDATSMIFFMDELDEGNQPDSLFPVQCMVTFSPFENI